MKEQWHNYRLFEGLFNDGWRLEQSHWGVEAYYPERIVERLGLVKTAKVTFQTIEEVDAYARGFMAALTYVDIGKGKK